MLMFFFFDGGKFILNDQNSTKYKYFYCQIGNLKKVIYFYKLKLRHFGQKYFLLLKWSWT